MYRYRKSFFLIRINSVRYVSNKSANKIRQTFLDYFIKENDHKFIKSSPVVPFCDPTLSFVNAGMNQFKGIFLGTHSTQHKRVANSQKCIRIGGKHNDLRLVGCDGYHHTFFEMLGNWSFGDYFKKEACSMAWTLLTNHYGLPPNSLYVTYFEGDKNLNIEPDEECKEIWKSIGVPSDHIIPFGTKDNFWEMGTTGPCGPCTEIHVDHKNGINRGCDVNKGLSDLTELWNIVFIQYNRDQDNKITSLPNRHVDTGMGFERLVALLQGKSSNYDTDLFTPIFNVIQQNCQCPPYSNQFGKNSQLDTAYRIIADHARMITACLTDGMVPDQNHKLRRIIRKTLITGEKSFKCKQGFLSQVCKQVINILGEVYPEMVKNSNQVDQILLYEEELLEALRNSTSSEWLDLIKINPELETLDLMEVPGLIAGYKELLNLEPKLRTIGTIPGDLCFKLYDTYGVDEEKIESLASLFNLNVNIDEFKYRLKSMQQHRKSKYESVYNKSNSDSEVLNYLTRNDVRHTDDSAKYNYYLDKKGSYIFPDLNATVQHISRNNDSYDIVLDKTNLYSEAGGQENDAGQIVFDNGVIFYVKNVSFSQGYVIHNGAFNNNNIDLSDLNKKVLIKINSEHRLSNMRNHTAIHLLNAVLKFILNRSVVCQRSSKVTSADLKFDVGVYGEKVSDNEIEIVERLVCEMISVKLPVNINVIDGQQLTARDDVTLIPGEVYPDTNIRIVTINDTINQTLIRSCEACCGTHVLNTGDIEDFCIISVKPSGKGTYSIRAVTGSEAAAARSKGLTLQTAVRNICNLYNGNSSSKSAEEWNKIVQNKIQKINNERDVIPYIVYNKCISQLKDLIDELKFAVRGSLKQFVEMEMKEVLKKTQSCGGKWIVHYLDSSSMLDEVPLRKATKVCKDIPVIVISYTDQIVKARCCIPENLVTEKFNAKRWLASTVGTIFKSEAVPPKGQNSQVVCNMKARKIKRNELESLLDDALTAANSYAATHLK